MSKHGEALLREQSVDQLESFDLCDDAASPSVQVALRDEVEVRRLVLTEEERRVVDMFANGFSISQIERELGPLKSGRPVRAVLKEAIERMRKYV